MNKRVLMEGQVGEGDYAWKYEVSEALRKDGTLVTSKNGSPMRKAEVFQEYDYDGKTRRSYVASNFDYKLWKEAQAKVWPIANGGLPDGIEPVWKKKQAEVQEETPCDTPASLEEDDIPF